MLNSEKEAGDGHAVVDLKSFARRQEVHLVWRKRVSSILRQRTDVIYGQRGKLAWKTETESNVV